MVLNSSLNSSLFWLRIEELLQHDDIDFFTESLRFLRTCFIHEQCVRFLSEKLKRNNQHQGGSEGLSLPRPPVVNAQILACRSKFRNLNQEKIGTEEKNCERCNLEKRRSYLFPSRECKVMMRSSSSGEMLPRLRSGRR